HVCIAADESPSNWYRVWKLMKAGMAIHTCPHAIHKRLSFASRATTTTATSQKVAESRNLIDKPHLTKPLACPTLLSICWGKYPGSVGNCRSGSLRNFLPGGP